MPADSPVGLLRCPTCPEGRCPSINTTPPYPEPDAPRIAAAELAIADALAESVIPIGNRYETPAEDLIEEVIKPKFGKHRLPATYWAIHRLIQKQMLSAHAQRIQVIGRNEDPPQKGGWFKRGSVAGFAWHEYNDEPAQYSTFIVRAEEALWQWYRSEESSTRRFENIAKSAKEQIEGGENDRPRYRPDDLLKELDIQTTNTLNKYARRAGVTTPARGERNHQYTENERRRIYRQIAVDTPDPASRVTVGSEVFHL